MRVFFVNFRILGRAPTAQGENAIVKRKSCPKKIKSEIQNISVVKKNLLHRLSWKIPLYLK